MSSVRTDTNEKSYASMECILKPPCDSFVVVGTSKIFSVTVFEHGNHTQELQKCSTAQD